jgi:hypothetical protein
MKLISLLLLTVSLSSTANECKISPDLLSAYYDFNQQTVNNPNPEVKNSPTQLFELHRNNKRVLQRDVNQGVHDIWSINGKRLSLNRAFQQYQHVIEYQPNELGYQPRWQDIFQLVTTPELNTMTLVEQKGSDCQLEQHYVLNTKKSAYQLVWLPKLQLVKFFEIISGNKTRQWALTNYQTNAEKITSLFIEYDNYQSTDYADVGDNESIPFLAAMINQGFSATQNTQALHQNHNSHHQAH